MRLVQIKELAPHMRPARRFLNRPVGAQHIKAAIGIGLQNALERLQMRLRMFTASIRRVSKPKRQGASLDPPADHPPHTSTDDRSLSFRCPAQVPAPGCHQRATYRQRARVFEAPRPVVATTMLYCPTQPANSSVGRESLLATLLRRNLLSA